LEFLQRLFERCRQDACLTLTAIHPNENRPVPSRHIPLGDTAQLHGSLKRLHVANDIGWGAYYSLATRQSGLGRWQRGGLSSLIEVPAIIADIDEAPEVALPRVQAFAIPPSLVVNSGHGLHLYWLLDQPTTDIQAVNAIHRGIAEVLQGDYLTAATAFRLLGSLNTKHGQIVPCEVLHSNWLRRYTLEEFSVYRLAAQALSRKEVSQSKSSTKWNKPVTLNPRMMQHVADILISRGYKWRDTWLNGTCPYAYRHKHADSNPSFGFNTATGYGYCFVCGSMLLKDVCAVLHIDPVGAGGLVCSLV